jgi:hypothetical protein
MFAYPNSTHNFPSKHKEMIMTLFIILINLPTDVMRYLLPLPQKVTSFCHQRSAVQFTLSREILYYHFITLVNKPLHIDTVLAPRVTIPGPPICFNLWSIYANILLL